MPRNTQHGRDEVLDEQVLDESLENDDSFDEDEEDDDDDEEEDEDEEEAPAPKAKAKASKGEKRSEKRCAKHHVNFPDEPEVRPIGEFYGKAQSSYCKKCMGILHKDRRTALGGSTSKKGSAMNGLIAATREAAEATIENNDSEVGTREDMWVYFSDNLQEAFYAFLDARMPQKAEA